MTKAAVTPEVHAASNVGGMDVTDVVAEGNMASTKGPEEFAEAALVPWISDENPTSDPKVFAELAAQLSIMQG